MSDEPPILAEGLHKSFGPVRALDGVSLQAPAGTVLAMLGPNGAGKTTAVRILTTLLRPDAGWARVGGYDVATQAAQVRSVVGLAGQYAAVDPLLTGRENLELIATFHHLAPRTARQRARALLERFDLGAVADRRAGGYSGGMRRRLDLAASLVGDPRVLLLDEPTAGLDPRSRQDLWDTLRDLVAQGTTALLTTQHLDEVDQLAEHVVVLDRGQVVADGTPDQLKERVGGHRIEVRLTHPEDATTAMHTVVRLGAGAPTLDDRTGTVVIPLAGGVAPIADVVRCLDDAGLGIADLVVRRPTLDDVYLALTDRERPGAAPPVPVTATGGTR